MSTMLTYRPVPFGGKLVLLGPDLNPCFLVAAPTMRCPFFNHTVVLLVDHGGEGSLGFVVNKPANIAFEQVLLQIGLDYDPKSLQESPVMLGGPVAPETGWVVFDPAGHEIADEGVLKVSDGIGICANLKMLESIACGGGPRHALMLLGYAGWGPGQLDDEIREGSWIVVDLDPKLVFDTPSEDCWKEALATLGIDPARVVGAVVADA